jgi:hypothetical protein
MRIREGPLRHLHVFDFHTFEVAQTHVRTFTDFQNAVPLAGTSSALLLK